LIVFVIVFKLTYDSFNSSQCRKFIFGNTNLYCLVNRDTCEQLACGIEMAGDWTSEQPPDLYEHHKLYIHSRLIGFRQGDGHTFAYAAAEVCQELAAFAFLVTEGLPACNNTCKEGLLKLNYY